MYTLFGTKWANMHFGPMSSSMAQTAAGGPTHTAHRRTTTEVQFDVFNSPQQVISFAARNVFMFVPGDGCDNIFE